MIQFSRTHNVAVNSYMSWVYSFWDLASWERTPEFVHFIDPNSVDLKLNYYQPTKTYAKLRLDGIRVLIVDDTQDNLLIVGHFLRGVGAAVDIAFNGQEAIECNRSRPYDIIIMDISMPVMDGAEATKRIRQQGYNIPIIALTAHALKEDRDRFMVSGFNEYLCKPVDKDSLIRSVSELINLRL